MLGEDSLDDLGFGYAFAGLGRVLTIRLEVVHVEAQDIAIFNGMGDGVLVQTALE
ncbi:hypothetical protein D3C72_2456750 [compost metagenome]